jgi:homoserine dehydrogenase
VGIATGRHGCAFDADGLDATAAAACVEGGGALHGGARLPGAADLIAAAASAGPARTAVVIETTPLSVLDGQPAASLLRAALSAGAHVITANKGPIACAWPELRAAARSAGRHLLFEGVVMDGIPVFSLAGDGLPALTITAIRGIVNTTTNYLLAALEEGREATTALADMRARGIAEADPSLDVDGWDAAAKAAALGNVLMDGRLTPAAVARSGVARLTCADARAALEAGCRLKLIMRVERTAQGVTASVAPERVPLDTLFARVNGTMNALTISTDALDDITIVQHGGTLRETAYALVADLVRLWRRIA